MTWPGLVLKNLLRRKVRTALTVAGVAIGVGLIVALLSITAGVKKTANQLIHVGRSDFGLFQQGAADLTRSVLPQSRPGSQGTYRIWPSVRASTFPITISSSPGQSSTDWIACASDGRPVVAMMKVIVLMRTAPS